MNEKTNSDSKTLAANISMKGDEMLLAVNSCSAQELVKALIVARGREEAAELLQEAAQFFKHQTTTGDPNANSMHMTEEFTNLGSPLLSTELETSLISPRLGKFQIQLFENGLKASKGKDLTVQLVVPSSNVSHVLVFPKPEDCKVLMQKGLSETARVKKLGGCLVLIRLHKAIPVQNKSHQHLCWTLPSDKKTGPTDPFLVTSCSTSENTESQDHRDPTQQWCDVLQKSLCNKTSVVRVQPGQMFQSSQLNQTSTTSGGMPFVLCNMGVSDGVLYPLSEGLLFYKPPFFIPRSHLASIACGRGGTSTGSSRYVDMIVQLHPLHRHGATTTVEFSNIQREENGVLNKYIHEVLIPAMQTDLATSDDKNGAVKDNILAVNAVVEDGDRDGNDEDTETNESITWEPNDGSDSDTHDEDFDENGGEDSDEDDIDNEAEGDEGADDVVVVEDDFAKELAKQRRANYEQGSAIESEDDGEIEGKRRVSKRLRKYVA